MTRLVTFVVLGKEFQTKVEAKDDAEARDIVTTQIAKQFHETFYVKAITTVKPRKRVSLWDTYKGGFLSFYHSIAQ